MKYYAMSKICLGIQNPETTGLSNSSYALLTLWNPFLPSVSAVKPALKHSCIFNAVDWFVVSVFALSSPPPSVAESSQAQNVKARNIHKKLKS